MFDKLKMKLATKRVQRQKDFAAADKRIKKNDSKLKRIVLWPFRMIGRGLRWIWDIVCAICAWIWEWLCGINIVGLINLTLLLAIIVVFSLLIIDIVGIRGNRLVTDTKHAKNVSVVSTKYDANSANTKEVPLPMPRGEVKNSDAKIAQKDATQNSDRSIYGDIIIESRSEAKVLKSGAHVHGNLYLQRMRKYVLPCGVVIDGSLFLRDVNMLQFCGPFAVRGNIYVSPKSSFGPIPYDSRIGGQVIL